MPVKNRLMFELLFAEGSFVQSRNFRLQKVGGIDWLLNAYDLASLARNVDELIITDLSQGNRPTVEFT